jgi:uncharacterized protein YdeI (YjbR/CyaY-like superfamily)
MIKSQTPKSPTELLDFRSAAEWRKWLQRNHAKSQGEWVYMYKRAAKSGLRYQEALNEALCFGWIDGQIKTVDKDRFKQRWTPRRPGSIWSRVNKARVKRLTAEGRMTEAGIAAVKTARKTGKWQKAYSNRRSALIPQELLGALRADENAWRGFNRLATAASMRVGSRTPSSPRPGSVESQPSYGGPEKFASRECHRSTSEYGNPESLVAMPRLMINVCGFRAC